MRESGEAAVKNDKWSRSFTSGEGKLEGMLFPRGFVSKASPRMEIKWWAMSFCCSTVQWFSKDKMTGYGEV